MGGVVAYRAWHPRKLYGAALAAELPQPSWIWMAGLLLAPVALIGFASWATSGVEPNDITRSFGIASFAYWLVPALLWARRRALGRRILALPREPYARMLLPLGLGFLVLAAFYVAFIPPLARHVMRVLGNFNMGAALLILWWLRPEFRDGGFARAGAIWRWQEVRGWSWHDGPRSPVLRLEADFWFRAGRTQLIAIPAEDKRAVEDALARFAQARPPGGASVAPA